MKKYILSGLVLFASLAGLAQNVGIGTSLPQQKLHVDGNVLVSDSIGVGITAINAQLQLASTLGNRKLVLYENNDNDNEVYGFGINPSTLRYQSAADHAFFAAASSTLSLERLRIKANGRVGIGTPNPITLLANTTTNVVGSDGFGVNISSLTWQSNAQGYVQNLYNSSTAPGSNGLAVRLAGTAANQRLLDLSTGGNESVPGTPVMVVRADGRVGIGNNAPAYKLDVTGSSRVTGDFIHTSADGGGTWVYLTNTSAVPTGWKLVTTPSPTASTGGDLLFYNNSNTPAFLVKQNGNVGINNGSPTEKLQVGGNISASGNVSVGEDLAVAGKVSAGGNFAMGIEYVYIEDVYPAMTYGSNICQCPDGKKVIGGGGGHRDNNSAQLDVSVNFSGPTPDGRSWKVNLYNNAPTSRTVRIWAICARVE